MLYPTGNRGYIKFVIPFVTLRKRDRRFHKISNPRPYLSISPSDYLSIRLIKICSRRSFFVQLFKIQDHINIWVYLAMSVCLSIWLKHAHVEASSPNYLKFIHYIIDKCLPQFGIENRPIHFRTKDVIDRYLKNAIIYNHIQWNLNLLKKYSNRWPNKMFKYLTIIPIIFWNDSDRKEVIYRKNTSSNKLIKLLTSISIIIFITFESWNYYKSGGGYKRFSTAEYSILTYLFSICLQKLFML